MQNAIRDESEMNIFFKWPTAHAHQERQLHETKPPEPTQTKNNKNKRATKKHEAHSLAKAKQSKKPKQE